MHPHMTLVHEDYFTTDNTTNGHVPNSLGNKQITKINSQIDYNRIGPFLSEEARLNSNIIIMKI